MFVDSNIKNGYVARYFPNKGYGFIKDYDDEDSYYFHITYLDKPFEIIEEKTRVVFEATENEIGLCAIHVNEYKPKIKGQFGKIALPNISLDLTNVESYKFQQEQHEKINVVLKELKKCGIKIKVASNGWITVDDSIYDQIEDITPEGGKCETDVPSGYLDTFKNILNLLQKQINNFNRSYNISTKGMQGEEKTAYSLRSVSINYPVLHNVLLEEGPAENRYSAETDTMIITDRAIFLIETKNYGGKGDKIIVSEDGRWEMFDGYKRKFNTIKNNPYKQVTDHVFVIKKFLDSHSILDPIPIIPIIAIANNDVDIEIEDNDLIKILRTELIGTFVLKHLESHPPVISKETMDNLRNIFDSEKLPPRRYKVVNWSENIKVVLTKFIDLINCYESDIILQEKQDAEEKHKLEEERKRKEEERKQKEIEEELLRRKIQSEKDKQKAEEERKKQFEQKAEEERQKQLELEEQKAKQRLNVLRMIFEIPRVIGYIIDNM